MKINKNRLKYNCSFLLTFLLLIVANKYVFQLDINNGDSMNPTIQEGDYSFSIKPPFITPKNGDLVTIEKEDMGERISKRIIAMEGDRLELTEDGDVYLNGEYLEEAYILEPAYYSEVSFVVPKGKVYVLGDNRNLSYDSRAFGFVDVEEVVGVELLTFR